MYKLLLLFKKTFLIAALLSMKKYNRLTVFLGCAGALVMMAFLACAFGHYLPMILHPKYTCLLAGLLFVFFGI